MGLAARQQFFDDHETFHSVIREKVDRGRFRSVLGQDMEQNAYSDESDRGFR